MSTVELRCEEFPRRLFAKMFVQSKPVVVEGNLIEFLCRDCSKAETKRIVHRFNVAGELVETCELPQG